MTKSVQFLLFKVSKYIDIYYKYVYIVKPVLGGHPFTSPTVLRDQLTSIHELAAAVDNINSIIFITLKYLYMDWN